MATATKTRLAFSSDRYIEKKNEGTHKSWLGVGSLMQTIEGGERTKNTFVAVKAND